MREVVLNVYKFNELPEDTQQEVINKQRDLYTQDHWWSFIEYEIHKQGGKLIEFDIDRNHIRLNMDYPIDFAKAIIEHSDGIHEPGSDTYILSEDFINGELSGKDYVRAIAQEYLTILRKEYEYITSDVCVRDGILLQENEYFIDGTVF